MIGQMTCLEVWRGNGSNSQWYEPKVDWKWLRMEEQKIHYKKIKKKSQF